MPYSTKDDILKQLPEITLIQLTDDEGTGTAGDARVAEAIAQADAEIDAYCGKRYGVPLSPAPDIARKISVDLAVYHLYSRRVGEVPQARTERYRAALRLLEGIARGAVSLGTDPDPRASTGGRAETNLDEDSQVFSREKLGGF